MQSGQGQVSAERTAWSLPQVRIEKLCRLQIRTLTGLHLDASNPRENVYHEQVHALAEEEGSCMCWLII